MYQTANLNITTETELSEIVLNHPRTMLFLEHFDIQVPLNTKTIGEVCEEKNISSDLFIAFANLYIGKDYKHSTILNYPDVLTIVEYLKKSHKYYLNEIYPDIQNALKTMKETNDIDEIKIIDRFFLVYFNEVREHLNYENEVAFPYIIDLYESVTGNMTCQFQRRYCVADYKEHHDDIEEKLDDLVKLLIKYLPNNNDQQARRKLFLLLAELDYDLKIHTSIEDLILTPLAAEMEKHVKSMS